MDYYLISETEANAIATAIQTKGGTSTAIQGSNFASAISAIPTGTGGVKVYADGLEMSDIIFVDTLPATLESNTLYVLKRQVN